MTGPKDDYERGRAEGEVRERLAAHDRRFDLINGQLGSISARLSDMVLALQRVGDQTSAGAEQQRMVTQALRDQAASQAASSAKAWAPWAKALAVAGTAAAVASVVITYLTTRG